MLEKAMFASDLEPGFILIDKDKEVDSLNLAYGKYFNFYFIKPNGAEAYGCFRIYW